MFSNYRQTCSCGRLLFLYLMFGFNMHSLLSQVAATVHFHLCLESIYPLNHSWRRRGGNKPWHVLEQRIHFLQRNSLCFGIKCPERDRLIHQHKREWGGRDGVGQCVARRTDLTFVKLQTTKRRKKRQPTRPRAMGVTCPIIVLNAKDIIVAALTPLERISVSKISEG